MSEIARGYILDVADNGDLKLSLPGDLTAEVGERFAVLDEQEKYVAEIKVVRTNESETVARFFQPFVTDEALQAAARGTAAGTAGAVGAIIGTVLLPLPLVGTALGAAAGYLASSALRRQRLREPIKRGMAIIPIKGSDKSIAVQA